MNAEQLLAYFDRISDAPDAIARLRQFILDLAVRGKLVEQNPEDEPASELIKRIELEKDRLIKEGLIKKRDSQRSLSNEEDRFEIPPNWTWTRLGEVGDWGSGSTPPRGNHEFFGGNITWLKSGELNDNPSLAGSEEKLTDAAIARCSFRKNRPGDVLFAMYGATIGKVAILAEAAVTNQAVVGCTPFSGVLNKYLFKFLIARRAQFHLASEGGAQPNVSKEKIVRCPFPLPPLAEQHRIVAKVDELMGLCDRLEAAQREREVCRTRLTAASLARLNQPADAPQFREHVRFHLQHFPRFTTRPDQIPHLRQTILNLAICGKLVRQDSADEPASSLLELVQKWRQKGIAEKKIRDPRKALSAISAEDCAYPLPKSWSWARLGHILYVHSGDALTAESMRKGEVPVFGGNGVNGFHDIGNVFEPSIVVGRVGYYCGSVHLTPKIAWVTDNALIAKYCRDAFSQEFMLLLLRSAKLNSNAGATAQPVISGSKIYPIVVGLPPLAEQHRIVAKVKELMTVCDQLETHLTTTKTESCRLLEATLHQALAPAMEHAV